MPIRRGVSLKEYAYYRTGGPCEALHEPESIEELVDTVRDLTARRVPYFLLGGGTNSLVMDEPFDGDVIVFRGLTRFEREGQGFVIGAGIDNTRVAETALKEGLAGAAWMNRLPGQIGGTVRMNARCYGGEISGIVTEVTAVSRDGRLVVYKDPKVFRGYKDTLFMENGDLIAEAKIALRPGDRDEIRALMEHCRRDRESKGQFDHPSCGCVFKNDHTLGVSSGILLDAAGAKQMAVGRARVSPHHANFVYNQGATSREILELTLAMREAVYRKFGAWLEYEMEILGRMPADLEAAVLEKRPHRLVERELEPLRAEFARRLAQSNVKREG